MLRTGEDQSFGVLLRELRLSAGLTQEDLAGRSGMSARSISDLERDGTRRPFFRSVELLADALEVPEPVRTRLRDAARSTHVAASQPATPGQAADPRGAPEAADVPVFQLPPVVAGFTGRAAECEHLRGMLAQSWDASVMPVAVVSGPPGIGKTMLALRVAHSLRSAFPDGQLYLQLAGASGRPRDAGEVLGDVLRALGTAPASIPDGAEQRAALYRSRLADRRMLVVADDAVSARQVRPLLPGTAGCAVLVTSRSRLADLGGARLVPLEPLTGAEAVQLLGRIVGEGRVTAESAAAAKLVRGCGLLPLAVCIAGAKLASRPRWPVRRMASLVADERRRLDELVVGDLAVRASVAPSYAALDERARRAFRLLSALGPVDVAEWVLAALLGEPNAADVVNTLADRSLLFAAGVDAAGEPRYRLHDLLRDYAAERLAGDPPSARDAAMDRVMAGYLELATLAHRSLPRLYFFPPVHPPVGDQAFTSGLTARMTAGPVAWFDSERLNLLAMITWACERGRYQAAARLAACHAGYLFLQHRMGDAGQMWTLVRDAAAIAGDNSAAADARFHLAWVMAERGRFAAAYVALKECVPVIEARGVSGHLATALYWRAFCAQHLGLRESEREDAERSIDLAQRLGEPGIEAMSLRLLGLTLVQAGDHDRGIALCEQAVRIGRNRGEPALEYHALTSLAYSLLLAGKNDLAENCCRRGITVCKRFDPYVTGEAFLLGMLGDAYIGQGRYLDGVDVLGTAMAVFEDRGDRWGAALCLLKRGRAYLALGRAGEAEALLERCLPIFRELDLPAYEDAAVAALRTCQTAPGRPARSGRSDRLAAARAVG